MKQYEKFAFAPINDGIIAPNIHKRKKSLTQEDIEQARNEAYREGENSQIAQAQVMAAESLRAIAHMMQMLLGKLQREANELSEDAVLVALEAAKAMSDKAIDQFETANIENYLKEAVSNLRNVPRVIVRLRPQICELVENSLEQCAKDIGFEGQIEVRPDESQQKGDCAIEWQGGAIRHDREQVLKNIEEAAQNWLESKADSELQLDLFG